MAQYVNFCYQPAIYISRILPGHANVEFIKEVLDRYNLGVVSYIEVKASPSSYEDHVATLYYAIVYFDSWNVNDTIEFRTTLMQGKFAKLYYNYSNFWKVSEYKQTSHAQNYMQQPVMKTPQVNRPIAPGLQVYLASAGHPHMNANYEMYPPPPPPKLQRQQCREYSDFDLFYHKLQVADFWHKQAQVPRETKDVECEPNYDEDDADYCTMDDALAEQFLNERKNKWDFKLHNGYRMFDFNDRMC
jgi:hypothetical protein